MKKIFYLVLSIVLISCGSRRTITSTTHVEKDSIYNSVKVDSSFKTKQLSDNSIKTTSLENFTLLVTPLDLTREFTFEGKTYKNVSLTVSNTKVNTLDKKNISIGETQGNKVRQTDKGKVSIKKKEKHKNSHRQSLDFRFLWILLAIPIYFIYRKFKRKTLVEN